MSDGVVVALLVPVAYLLGTFPSATIVAAPQGVDVTAEGSGNPGASNTFRLLGWKAGRARLRARRREGRARRAASGCSSTATVGAYVLGSRRSSATCSRSPVGFKGGRGVATGAGVLLVIFPLIALAVARGVGRDRAASRTRRRSHRSWWWSRSRSRSRSPGTPWWDVTVIAACRRARGRSPRREPAAARRGARSSDSIPARTASADRRRRRRADG